MPLSSLPESRAFVSAVVLATLATGPTVAFGQVGEAGDGLPGILRTPVHEERATDRPVVVSATGSYGFTESVLDSGEDAHHRLAGSLAVGWRPWSFLATSLRLDGRYDRHTGVGPGENDDGFLGVPRLTVRTGTTVSDLVSVGAQTVVWFHGADAPSIVVDAVSADVEAFLTVRPAANLALALRAGWRFDESPDAISNPQDLTPADRLGLGASDADALLIGLGASARLSDAIELVGEWTWDLLLGEAAPEAVASPMRLGGGVRWRPLPGGDADRVELVGLVDLSLSKRPDLSDPWGPLVPVEPRFTMTLGVNVRLGDPPGDGSGDASAGPVPGALAVTVVDDSDDAPLPDAVVRLEPAPTAPPPTDEEMSTLDARTADAPSLPVAPDGTVDASELAPGRWHLITSHEGYETDDRLIVIAEGATTTEAVRLVAVPAGPAMGALRGVVRSFSGRTIRATVRVEPTERPASLPDGADPTLIGPDGAPLRAETDRFGEFELSLPVGRHLVVIESPRYRTQRRVVVIEEDGVTILNADLRRGRARSRRRRPPR